MEIEFENSIRRLSFLCCLTDIKIALDKSLPKKLLPSLFNNSELRSKLRQIGTCMQSFIEQLPGFKSYSNIKLKTITLNGKEMKQMILLLGIEIYILKNMSALL